jgi:hypothetical protein
MMSAMKVAVMNISVEKARLLTSEGAIHRARITPYH